MSEIDSFYLSKKNTNKSISKGNVSNGRLINGKLMPFSGENFAYFDKDSYLAGRAFTHEKTKTIVLNVYDSLKSLMPERKFFLMECSNEHGGKIYPHRTHQNGLSIDFMMPKLKNNETYYGLDTLGKNHYWLNFDNHGNYVDDPSVKIDFDLIAQHLLILESLANEQEMKIEKVIIKVSYKEPLYNTEYGKKLKNSGIYIVKSLSPTIDNLHDEHYHVDFAFLE